MEEAIVLLKDLVADRQRVLGPDHPDTLATRSNLAGNLAEVGAARKQSPNSRVCTPMCCGS